MWNLPQPGNKPLYPAFAGGFWPTVPPGKSWFLQILHPKSKMLPKGHNNGYGEVTSIKPNSHNWYHHLSRPQAHSATPRDWAHVCEQGVRKRSTLSRLHLVPPAIPALGGGEAPPGEPGKGCNSSNEGPAPAEVPSRRPRPCVFAGFRSAAAPPLHALGVLKPRPRLLRACALGSGPPAHLCRWDVQRLSAVSWDPGRPQESGICAASWALFGIFVSQVTGSPSEPGLPGNVQVGGAGSPAGSWGLVFPGPISSASSGRGRASRRSPPFSGRLPGPTVGICRTSDQRWWVNVWAGAPRILRK